MSHALIATRVVDEGASQAVWLFVGVLVLLLALGAFAAWWRGRRRGSHHGRGWDGPLGPEDGERAVSGAIGALRNNGSP